MPVVIDVPGPSRMDGSLLVSQGMSYIKTTEDFTCNLQDRFI